MAHTAFSVRDAFVFILCGYGNILPKNKSHVKASNDREIVKLKLIKLSLEI